MTTVNTMPSGATSRFSENAYASLVRFEDELSDFARRLTRVVNAHAELVRLGRGRPFIVYHLAAYSMLLAERDMVIVDIASWAKWIAHQNGFLQNLDDADRHALSWTWPTGDPGEPIWNETWRREAFARLFPTAADPAPSKDDIAALCKRLFVEFGPLRRDRNQHRAHRYERESPVTAQRLSPGAVIPHLRRCQDLVADLRCLSSNSSFTEYGYRVEPDPTDEQARDLIDLVLLGGLGAIVDRSVVALRGPDDRRYAQMRAAHYERLHAAYEAAGQPEGEPFNNRALLGPPPPIGDRR